MVRRWQRRCTCWISRAAQSNELPEAALLRRGRRRWPDTLHLRETHLMTAGLELQVVERWVRV